MGKWRASVEEDFQNNGYTVKNMRLEGEVHCIELPGMHEGRPITSIDSNFMEECIEGAQSIRKIVLPEGLLEIGVGSFRGLKNLEEIVLPNSLKTISHNAFEGCVKLKKLVTGDDFEGFGQEAFKDCTELEEVVLSSKTEFFNIGAFSGCKKLKKINIPSSVMEISSGTFSGCTALESITLPFVGGTRDGKWYGDLSYIFGSYCVKNTLKHVCISEDTVLMKEAFKECTALESIELPRGFSSSENTFRDCTNLKRVYYNGEIEDWCSKDFSAFYSNPLSNGAELYLNGALLKKAVIPSVERIKEDAFWGCVSIEEVEIPDTVNSIGSGAFKGCQGLRSIEIPKSITEIGYNAFSYCDNLEDIKILGKVKEIGCINNCKRIKSVVLPSGVVTVMEGAFQNCPALESVTLPATVKIVHYSAFYDCPMVTIYSKAKKPVVWEWWNDRGTPPIVWGA